MLRVGLTGGLGSGKSTVAGYLRELGAEVIEADALGRALMEPGQTVYADIVRVFGPEVVKPDGRLDRARLAEIAFQGDRLQELNAIVHPAVIAAQQQLDGRSLLARSRRRRRRRVRAHLRSRAGRPCPRRDGNVLADWRRRIDRVMVVTAPDELKIARYVERLSPAAADRAAVEAERATRLAHQIPDAEKAAQADYVLENTGDMASLRAQVERSGSG